jgi:protein-tyrosine phosphatase
VRFVDVHTHFLPGLDDGPEDVEQAVALLAQAHADGARTLVATPHMFLPPFHNHEPGPVRWAFEDLLLRLRQRAAEPRFAFLAELELLLGAENHLSPELLNALESRSVLTLNDTAYLLIELPPYLGAEMALAAMERMLGAGFVPVLAHVERYALFQAHADRLAAFVARGCVAQVNASSLLGWGSRRQTRAARAFLDARLVQVIASDAHDTHARPPCLGMVAASLRKHRSEAEIADWLSGNPARILANRQLWRPVAASRQG